MSLLMRRRMLLVPKEPTNLFNIDDVNGAAQWDTSTPNVAGGGQYGTKTVNNELWLKYGVYANATIWTGAKIPIEQGGDYYLSCDCKVKSSSLTSNINFCFVNKSKNVRSDRVYFNNISVRDKYVQIEVKKVTIPDDWVGDDVYLSLQSTGGSQQFTNVPIYARNIIITYGEH